MLHASDFVTLVGVISRRICSTVSILHRKRVLLDSSLDLINTPSLSPNLGPTSLDSPPQLLPTQHSFQPITRAARPLVPRKRRPSRSNFNRPDLPP